MFWDVTWLGAVSWSRELYLESFPGSGLPHYHSSIGHLRNHAEGCRSSPVTPLQPQSCLLSPTLQT